MDLKKAKIDPQLIEQLRVRIYEYLATEPEGIVIKDVHQRIRAPGEEGPRGKESEHQISDLMLRRFLQMIKPSRDIELALQAFIEVFQFRARHKVGAMQADFIIPAEFYHVAPFVCDGFDRRGAKLVMIRVKYYRRLPQMDVLIRNGLLFLMEQVELAYERGDYRAITLVFDFADFDYFSNYNFSLLRFAVDTFLHYRGVITCVLLYSFPSVFAWLLKLVESWLWWKQKFIHVVDGESIDQFVERDERPAFLNGTKVMRVEVPPGVVPFREMVQKEENEGLLEPKNAARIADYIDSLMEEAGKTIEM